MAAGLTGQGDRGASRASATGTPRGILALLTLAVLVLTVALAGVRPARPAAGPPGAAAPGEVRILAGEPATLDPAAQGDIGSAAITAQLFESVTALDASLTVRPALAASWEIADAGRRVTFALRPGLTFSDGTALGATDIVESWLRLIDPSAPSPLASLLDDVDGARAYRRGQAQDPASVGIRATDATHVEVRLAQPGASDFLAIVAGASFGVVPPAVRRGDPGALEPGRFVGSGGYVLAARTAAELTLHANAHYWAGRPAIAVVHVVTTLGGKSPVEAFAAGQLDYTPISDYDASWIAYDRTLGPSLRGVPSLDLTYYGFDTSRPPFDDVRVRRAVAQAVDWRRIVALGSTGSDTVATSMVPPGIPGRPSGDLLPAFDPAAARALLAEAGHAGGAGLGTIEMVTAGGPYDAAVAAQLRSNLGLTVSLETMSFDAYQRRLALDPPPIWSMSWIADYPGANDFLGVLLGSDATNDYGRWTSKEFDAALERAGAAADQASAGAAYADAARIAARDVPVVPVSYSAGWALSADGLLGAGQNGLGIVRFAGLAWQP